MELVGDILRIPSLALAGILAAMSLRLLVARVIEARQYGMSNDLLGLVLIDLALLLAALQNILVTVKLVGTEPRWYGAIMSTIWLACAVAAVLMRRKVIMHRADHVLDDSTPDDRSRKYASRR